MIDRTLIYPGEAVKALGSGRVGGYLVRFGGPESADSQGEYFTATTDYGIDLAAKARVVYHHGLSRANDPLSSQLGKSRIGTVELRMQPDGLYAEGEIDLSREPVKALYARIEAGEIGWSSGSTERLVERQPVKGKTEIKSWPIIEASLSPCPVDPRNRALAIKALIDETPAGAVAAPTLIDRAETLVAEVDAICGLFAKAQSQREASGRVLSAPKRQAIKALADSLARLHDASSPAPDPQQLDALRRRVLLQRIEALGHAGNQHAALKG